MKNNNEEQNETNTAEKERIRGNKKIEQRRETETEHC